MPTPDLAIPGVPCWTDLMTSDPDASAAFYGELFGWTVMDPGPDYGGYKQLHLDGQPVGGMMGQDGSSGMPDAWSVYLATDDIKRTVADATAAGAQVFVEPMAVHALGSMAVMSGPDGAAIGAWQPDEFPGFGVAYETNAPAWFELHTRDYDKALGFYRDVFKWNTKVESDEPDFKYTTLIKGETQYAGVMDASAWLPEGVPAHWSVYFSVEDADAALAKIGKLGGSTIMGAEDTPYGRLATAADPTGAIFKLQQPTS